MRSATQPAPTDTTTWSIADIVVEVNPGFFSHTLTVPVELLEFDMSWAEARGTRPVQGDQGEEHQAKDVEDKAIDIGQQTKVPSGDYKLSTESYNALKL